MNLKNIHPIVLDILTFIYREFSSVEARDWLYQYDPSLMMVMRGSDIYVCHEGRICNNSTSETLTLPKDADSKLADLIKSKYSFPDVSELNRFAYQGLCREYYNEFFNRYFGDYLDEAVYLKPRQVKFIFQPNGFSFGVPMVPPRSPKVDSFKTLSIRALFGKQRLLEHVVKKHPEQMVLYMGGDHHAVWDVNGKTHYHNFPYNHSCDHVPLDI